MNVEVPPPHPIIEIDLSYGKRNSVKHVIPKLTSGNIFNTTGLYIRQRL